MTTSIHIQREDSNSNPKSRAPEQGELGRRAGRHRVLQGQRTAQEGSDAMDGGWGLGFGCWMTLWMRDDMDDQAT